MIRRDPFLTLALIVYIVLCGALGTRVPVDVESVDLALAVHQQDVRLHQPPPPGAVVCVWLVQLVYAFTGNTVLALRVVALVMMCGTAVLVHRIASTVVTVRAARWATLLFLFSPLALYYGMTMSARPAQAFATALAAWLCLGTRRVGSFTRTAYVVGLVGGLYQTAIVVTVPLLAWTAQRLHLERRARFLAAVAWLAGTACWLLPQLEHAGGVEDYARSSVTMLAHALRARAAEPLGGVHALAVGVVCGLGVVRVLAWLVASGRQAQRAPAQSSGVGLERPFLLAWIVPALVVSLWSEHPSASVLVAWPALVLVVAASLSRAAVAGRARHTRPVLAGAALIFDVALFFALPPTLLATHAARASADTRIEDLARTTPRCVHAWWTRAPSSVQRAARTVFARVDFFFDRTRHPEFDGFVRAVTALADPADRVLVLGGRASRALCWLSPEIDVIHADPRRPEPFLAYRDHRARRLEAAYEVSARVTMVLVEGDPAQVQAVPLETAPAPGPGGLHVIPIGNHAVDAWFLPAGAQGPRLRLVRELLPVEPGAVFERTAR